MAVNSSATHSISSDLATVGVRISSDLGVGISGTVNINKIDGATNAKVENTDVAGNADTFVNAVDYTNNGSFIGNAAISGTVAVGVLWNENQVNRETNSLVNGSALNVKNLDVKADSEQGLSNLNIAVGVAFAASKSQVFAAASGDNIVRNQMESTTTAKLENATVNHSDAVNVNAKNTSEIKADGGVAAVSLNISKTFFASMGAAVANTENASKENAQSDSDKLNGEFGSEERFIDSDTVSTLLGGIHYNSDESKNNIKTTLENRHTATVNQDNSLKKGVFANVQNNSNINAGENNISIGSTENNDLSITSGSGNAGPIGIGVGSTTIETRRANTANVVGSTLVAKNINISTTNGQTGSDSILSKMYNATLASYGVNVGYNNVETNGTGEILIANSTLNATENINAKAIDNSKSKSYILDAGLKMYGYTGVFAYNTNTSQTGIEVSNNSGLIAKAINLDAENHTHRATDTLAISAGVINVQTNTSEAKDTSTNFIKVTGSGNNFLADEVNITAQIGEEGKTSAMTEGFGLSVSGLNVNVDNMTAQTESTANIEIGNEIYGDDTTLNVNALNKASRDAYMRNNAYAVVANANDISSYTIAKDKASVTVGSDKVLENSNKLTALNITADSLNKSRKLMTRSTTTI